MFTLPFRYHNYLMIIVKYPSENTVANSDIASKVYHKYLSNGRIFLENIVFSGILI